MSEQEVPSVETGLNPVDVEKELLERTRKQEEEALKRSPEDVAASMFAHYLPFLKNVLNNKSRMTRKSLIKVFIAAIESPLNGDEFKLLKKDEREVYSVAMGCLEAKWQMMLTVLMTTQQKMAEEKAAKEAIDSGVQSNTLGPVTNEELEKIVLSDKDRDLFLATLENPPEPNEALKTLAQNSTANESSDVVQP